MTRRGVTRSTVTRSTVTRSMTKKLENYQHHELQHQKRVRHPKIIPPFRLLDLPQEIADMIYRRLIRAGQVQVLRACSAINNAGSRLTLSEGVVRILPADQTPIPYDRMVSDRFAATIQHIEIRPHSSFIYSEVQPDLECFALLNFQSVQRQSFTIAYQDEKYWSWKQQSLLYILGKTKSDFEKIVLCCYPGLKPYTREEISLYLRNRQNGRPWYRSNDILKRFVAILGPATFKFDTERLDYVEFRPRLHRARLAAKKKSAIDS